MFNNRIKENRLKKIAAGHYHSVFVDKNGEVLTCGSGRFGQLGHGNKDYC